MILLIDCSKGLHLILGNKKKIIATSFKPRLKKVSECLVLEIENLLKSNSKDYKNLTKIIAINGPGSFTGIRTSVTVAKVLGLTLNIPVCGISLFDLMLMQHKNIKTNSDQKFFIHLNDERFFVQDIYKSGKKSEVSIMNFKAELLLDFRNFQIVSMDNKVVKSLRTIRNNNQKHNIFIYNDIFFKSYDILVNFSEKKYVPNPIYVKTF